MGDTDDFTTRNDSELRQRATEEALEISRISRVAFVYQLRNGKYIATATEQHLVPGKLLQTAVDGKFH